jgi:hypothetical protein
MDVKNNHGRAVARDARANSMTADIRRRSYVALVLAVAAIAPAAGTPQSGRAQIYATVVDDTRRPVEGLGSEDIVLRDGGVRQVSLAVERAAEPLAIAVSLEGFGSADVPDLRRALDTFARAIRTGNAASQVGLITRAGPGGRRVVLLTGDAARLDAELADLTAAASSAIVEDVSDACLAVRAAPTDRLAVLALIRRRPDDGALSQTERLTDTLFRTRTALWTIEVAPPAAVAGGARRPNGLDAVLTAGVQLGGALRETVADTSALVSSAERVASLLLSQYVVTYTWPDPMLSLVSLTTRHDRGQVLTPAWSR